MRLHLCCVAIFLAIQFEQKYVKSAEILIVAPVQSHSHFIIPFRIAQKLVNRGHKITMISPYPQKQKVENYTDVPIEENLYEEAAKTRKALASLKESSSATFLLYLFDYSAILTNITIRSNNVQELLRSGRTFDVIVLEHFLNEALMGFGHIFKAPVVLEYSLAVNFMNDYIFANPALPSYVPVYESSFTKNMNFPLRLQNYVSHIIHRGMLHFYHMPLQRQLFKSYITDVEFDEVLHKASMLLTNSHPAISNPVPLVPNIVEVGGLHINTKAIPRDLKEFLDNSNEGVVLFSLGSIFKVGHLSPETTKTILKVLSKIQRKVLFKCELDLQDVPNTVKIMPWMPQEDILSHPNVKVFITHGGRMGTLEAVYNQVPIVGIPLFRDQLNNVGAAVDDGYGVRIDLNNLTEENLSWALNEVLTNAKYTDAVVERSRLLKDMPMKSLEMAVYWIEHIARHSKNATYLRLYSRWYQTEMLDVIAFILITFIFVVIVGVKLVAMALTYMYGKNKKKT